MANLVWYQFPDTIGNPCLQSLGIQEPVCFAGEEMCDPEHPDADIYFVFYANILHDNIYGTSAILQNPNRFIRFWFVSDGERWTQSTSFPTLNGEYQGTDVMQRLSKILSGSDKQSVQRVIREYLSEE